MNARGGIDVMKLHQRIIAFDIVRFAGRHVEGQRVAFGVGSQVDFGREAATRTTECFLIFDSPFYAGCMLMRPDDREIDGMFLVGRRPQTRQGF